jgi:hypothetical protein
MRHKITSNNFLVLFGIMLLVAFAAGCNNNGKAQENRIEFVNNFSGSFFASSIDTNGDDETGVVAPLQGSLGSLGTVTFQSYFEGDVVDPAGMPCTTPNGLPGVLVDLVEADSVFRLENTGELIFTHSTSGTACFPLTPGDNSFGFTAVDEVTGGTGMLENATGSIETDGSGISLVGLADFGGVTGVQTGEIILE